MGGNMHQPHQLTRLQFEELLQLEGQRNTPRFGWVVEACLLLEGEDGGKQFIKYIT